jgi:hypothetical protein
VDLNTAEVLAKAYTRSTAAPMNREALELLLTEYHQMRAELAENVGVMNALRRHRDTAESELTSQRPLVEAATALAVKWNVMRGSWDPDQMDELGNLLDTLQLAVERP